MLQISKPPFSNPALRLLKINFTIPLSPSHSHLPEYLRAGPLRQTRITAQGFRSAWMAPRQVPRSGSHRWQNSAGWPMRYRSLGGLVAPLLGKILDQGVCVALSVGVSDPCSPHLRTPNPGPVRPRITPPDTLFPEFSAKRGAFLHIIWKYSIFMGFKPNGRFYVAGKRFAFVRFWEAEVRGAKGAGRSNAAKTRLWPSGRHVPDFTSEGALYSTSGIRKRTLIPRGKYRRTSEEIFSQIAKKIIVFFEIDLWLISVWEYRFPIQMYSEWKIELFTGLAMVHSRNRWRSWWWLRVDVTL